MIDMQKVRSLPNCKIDYAAANEMHKVTAQMRPDDDGNPDYGQIIGAYLGWALDEIDRLREALIDERAYIYSCNVIESMGVDETFRAAARQHLEAEGKI